MTEKMIDNPVSDSIFLHDEIISSHQRFQALTRNIKERRGEKPNIKIPIFKDIHSNNQDPKIEPYPDYVYMDAMGFGCFYKINKYFYKINQLGMGYSCIQSTFSTQSINHARFLYDQLAILSPLLVNSFFLF